VNAEIAGDRAEPVGVRTRNLHRLAREPREGLFSVARADELARPAARRVDRDERLGKENHARALGRCFAGDRRELLDRGGAVEGDRLDLRAGDSNRCVHSVDRDDLVADGDHAVRDDVRVQSAAVHEAFDHSGLGQPLERRAGMAQLDAHALHVADAKPLADELVQFDALCQDVAP
jgi:hypothetical protein